MHSLGHKANILNSQFEDVGVGFARRPRNPNASGGTYTTDFGAPPLRPAYLYSGAARARCSWLHSAFQA